MNNYFNKIASFINENNCKGSLILIWNGIPDIQLCNHINVKFKKIIIYWLFIVDISLLNEKLLIDVNKYFNNDFNFLNILNPTGISVININDNTVFWILNKSYQYTWNEYVQYFPYLFVNFKELNYHKKDIKPWFKREFNQQKVDNVVVIGAGISGASTARYLANRGVKVDVLDKGFIASGASGNKQSILYAKISVHNTAQTQLLLQSYSFALQNLKSFLPNKEFWDDCGVLHLDFNSYEKQRNLNLAKSNFKLYKYLNSSQASKVSGVDLLFGGLFWTYGAWVNPKVLIKELLNHKLICVREHAKVNNIVFNHSNNSWELLVNNNNLKCNNLVLCTGGQSNNFSSITGLNFSIIRGQTTIIPANSYSNKLKVVLSGNSYIPPNFQDSHCIGSTFNPNNFNSAVNCKDNVENLDKLKDINIKLFQSFENNNILKAHSALRCDSYNHLPVVGMVGDSLKMQKLYFKLKSDKNYKLNMKCPYIKGLYINTAHGSRGMLTSMMCSEYLVSEMLNLPSPFNFSLRSNLSPNKIIINNLIRNKV